MQSLTSHPLLTFDEQRFTIGDAMLGALARGEWQRFERDLASALATEREVVTGRPRYEEALHELGVAWRSARGLVAGEDFSAWLAQRGLSVEDWQAHLRRRLAMAQAAEGRSDEGGAQMPPRALAAVVRAEVLCSGMLAALGNALITRCAARRALAEDDGSGNEPAAALISRRVHQLAGEAIANETAGLASVPAPELMRRAKTVLTLEDVLARFTAKVADAAAIERWLRVKRMQLLRFAWHDALFGTENAAREAAMLVREGRMSLGQVAQAAGAETARRAAYASELDFSLGPRLAGAVAGELVGPFQEGRTWRLVDVEDRTAPSPEDPELRRRAIDAIVADRLERHIAGKVVWHVDP
jgi:hypothetical protein